MKKAASILAAFAMTTSLAACELGDEEFEPTDELLDTLDEAYANAELPDAVIAGGRPDQTNHISVGYLSAPNGLRCSGQRITKTLFLTAAHCIRSVNRAGIAWNRVKVGFGRVSADFHVKASRAVEHPSYNGAVTSPFDIGVVVMSRGVPFVPNASIGRSRVGQIVQHVGYGLSTTQASSFKRRSGFATISRILGNGTIMISGADARTCGGDSGGGSMNPQKQNQLISLASFGPNNCQQIGEVGQANPRREGNRQFLQFVGTKFD